MRYEIFRPDLHAAKREILRLWGGNFAGLPDGRYGWLYESNPSGAAACWFGVEALTGSVVGSTALFPRRVMIHGEPRVAAIAGDFMVDAHRRAFGPAVALQRAAIAACAEMDFAYLYGMPTPSAIPAQRRAGYRIVGSTYRLAKVMRTASYFLRPGAPRAMGLMVHAADAILTVGAAEVWRRAPRHITLEVCNTFDTRFDDLWRSACATYPLIGERGSAFLNWRFARCPERTYTTYALIREGSREVLGYVVARRVEDAVYISDFFAGGSGKVADALLTMFLRLQRRSGVSIVYVTYFGNKAFVKKLQRFGFSIRDRKTPILAYAPLGSREAEWIYNTENWCLFEADTDT